MKLLKLLGFVVVFIVSFLVFLYWMFPYDVLKDRMLMEVERNLGGDVAIKLDAFHPYYFTGVKLSKLEVSSKNADHPDKIFSLDEATARVTMMSLLLGRPRVTFYLRFGKGVVEGDAKWLDNVYDIDVDVENVNLHEFPILQSRFGVELKSLMSGNIQLHYDRQNITKSSGKIKLKIPNLEIVSAKIPLGEGGSIDIPPLVLSQGKTSELSGVLDKGVLNADHLSLLGGDAGFNLSGKMMLSNDVSNAKLDLSGTFFDSPKLLEAFPLLFIIEKQKAADGSYPLSVTGRLVQPSIRIGTFTVPL